MPLLSKDQVLEAALELDEQEREEVIARLSGADTSARLTPEQEEELREHRENPGDARPWSEIEASLLAKL